MFSKTHKIRIQLAMLVGVLLIFAVHSVEGRGLMIVSEAIQPHVAVDNDGDIYVVFIHEGNICVSVSRNRGVNFSAPVIAIDVKGRARGGMQRGPRIGVDARKNLTVTAPVVFDDAEYEKQYPTADLYLVTSRDGGQTWSEPIRVNEVPKKAPESLHWMGVAPTGEAHIAWLDLRSRQGPGQDVYYAKVTDGKVGENIKIASTVCECCAPGLAVSSDGNPFVAYREGGQKESREIYATYSADNGRSFSEPVQLNREPSNEHG
jgi:hypothetical protein